jgi:integrase
MQLPTLEPTVVRSRSRRIPKLGDHAATGQARVVIEGRSIYLGRAGPEANERYRQLISTWLSTGELPEARAAAAAAVASPKTLTVGDVAARFLEKHATYYRHRDGTETGELSNFAEAFKPLLARCADLPAEQFSPRRLKDVQEAMVRVGWARPTINKQVGRVKHVFKWATSEELVPAGVYHGLLSVDGLKRNRTDAPEPDPVVPVPEAAYEATLPELPKMVRAMVELQYWTGMRPSEVIGMRTGEIDRRGEVWRYSPRDHKTAYCGKTRVVPIGPKAQAILRPWLKLAPDAPIFSPAEGEKRRHRDERAKRKTKVQPSQLARAEASAARAGERELPPGEMYRVDTYRRAIARACKRAGVAVWAPARLRHNAGERIRRAFGVETARCYLGHSEIRTTQLYSSMDEAKALDAAARVG